MILALRLTFPDAGLTLSTREPAELRSQLVRLGITQMSAGSRTHPGAYAEAPAAAPTETGQGATEQFAVADTRTAAEVTAWLRAQEYDPVWKDWE